MRALVILIALVFSPALGAAERPDGPVEMIRGIYKTYQEKPDPPARKDYFSKRLKQLLDEDERNTPQGEVGRLDWDVFVDGNDWDITDLDVRGVEETETAALVSASFKNHREAREILFHLVREGAIWVIDEVSSTRAGGRWTMSKILTGAPDAFPDEPPAGTEVFSDPEGSPAPPPGEGLE